MRRIRIENVKEGDVLAENLYSANGSRLLTEGTNLSHKMIERLKQMGFLRILIDDKRFEGIHIQEDNVITEKTRKEALSTVNNILNDFQKSGKLNGINEVKKVANTILEEVLTSKVASVDISILQSYDQGTYTHSLSVTLLSIYLANQLKLNKNQLLDITIGCLLHDIGKVNIPLEILNKPGKLTDEEFDIVKLHPFDGYYAIKDKISLLSAHIALQHHEKYDGTGYPRQIKGEEIHLYGRITAIADVYDAITADRPYRKGMLPDRAAEILMKSSGSHFDPKILTEFLNLVSAYPNGSIVELNDNSNAIVVSQNKGNPFRPNIVIFKRESQILKEYNSVDLTKNHDYTISRVCES